MTIGQAVLVWAHSLAQPIVGIGSNKEKTCSNPRALGCGGARYPCSLVVVIVWFSNSLEALEFPSVLGFAVFSHFSLENNFSKHIGTPPIIFAFV